MLLIDPSDPAGEVTGGLLGAGPLASFAIPIPADTAFAGYEVATQVVHSWGVRPFALSNAQDLVLGL